MEYTIVSGETIEALLGIVNEKLNLEKEDKWALHEGPFTVDVKLWAARPKGVKGSLVCQALVRNVGDGVG